MQWNHSTRRTGIVRVTAGCLAVLATLVVLANAAPKSTLAKKPNFAKKLAKDRRAQMTDVFYAQDVRSFSQILTVTLNGWPVADVVGGQDAGLINYAVIDGANHLAATIAAPPGGKKTDLVGTAMVLIQKDDATVFALKWKADATPPQPLPIHKELTFESGTHFGPRVWQSAPQITLDAATKQAIRAQAHRFRDTLDAKDLDGMVRMFAVRDREDALSHGEAPQQNAIAAREDYQEMLSRPHWRMEPVHDDHLQFHLIADKRVVLVDYGPDNGVLETVPDPSGDVNGFHLYLSLVNGQWTIVR